MVSNEDNVVAVDRAIRKVRRVDFLLPELRERTHEDRPLPIGYEQTISQPSLVAEMTRRLKIEPQSRVLEIGTGSGYQTAILAEIAGEVFTVERITELADAARVRLSALGYHNIHFRIGDGAAGWPEEAPFDRIIVTAAPADIPIALLKQLNATGRMVIPVGADRDDQTLFLIGKDEHGATWTRELFGVRFVPLISDN